jgi:hypothetical protein
MNINITDKITTPSLFGNDAAEDEESSVLNSYFVLFDNHQDFFSSDNKLKFVRARKGEGKSALLSVTAYKKNLSDEKPLVITLSGPSIPCMVDNVLKSPNELITDWQQELCQSINIEIGKELGFGFSDTSLSMRELAEISGNKKRNFLSSLIERINLKVLDSEINISNTSVGDHQALLSRYIGESLNREIWLIIDDVDATFQNTTNEKLTLSAFFSACRALTRSVDGLIIRGAVRSDTWETIREFDESLDKMDQYLLDVKWTSKSLIKVISERVRRFIGEELSYPDAEGLSDEDLITLLFPSDAGWGNKSGRFQLLTQISNGRPRWALQACKLAAIEANSRGTIISRKVMRHILPQYGNLRIKDLISEYSNQISGLREVITYFSYKERGYSTEELIEHCNKITSEVKLTLNSKEVELGRVLARFLYSTGFLIGREDIDGRFQQFTFDEQPFHLSTDFNPLGDNVNWEIQSSYQRALRLTNVSPHLT